MKSISSYLLRSLCTLMVGLLLILNPDTPTLLIQVIGALFALSGLYAVLTNTISRFSRNAEIRPSFPLVGIGCLLAGVILGLYPEYFLQGLMYLLGALILLLGIGQLIAVFHYRRLAPLKWSVFVVPVLLILAGIFVLAYYHEAAALPFTILGVCCIFNGLSDLFYGLRLRHYESLNKKFTEYEEVVDEIEDAEEVEEAEEIKS